MARLHLICGNCGCGDDWTWRHVPEKKCGEDLINVETVYITCGNCSTLHNLEDYAHSHAEKSCSE